MSLEPSWFDSLPRFACKNNLTCVNTTPHPNSLCLSCQDRINGVHWQESAIKQAVEHPEHYGGADNPYECIKVCEAWGLDKDALLFNTVKYINRAGKKGSALEDLEKARWYLDRKIKNLRRENGYN